MHISFNVVETADEENACDDRYAFCLSNQVLVFLRVPFVLLNNFRFCVQSAKEV